LPERFFASRILLNCLCILAALSLPGSQASQSQEVEKPPKDGNQVVQPVEREIVWEGLASYGNYKIFATEGGTKIYTSGFEYDPIPGATSCARGWITWRSFCPWFFSANLLTAIILAIR
jgi:hypothetical protein